MNSKRILGYIFILLACILTLAIIGQLHTLLGDFFSLFKLFTGKLNGYQVGKTIGHIIYWIAHFAATIALWKYGIKWSKKVEDRVLRRLSGNQSHYTVRVY